MRTSLGWKNETGNRVKQGDQNVKTNSFYLTPPFSSHPWSFSSPCLRQQCFAEYAFIHMSVRAVACKPKTKPVLETEWTSNQWLEGRAVGGVPSPSTPKPGCAISKMLMQASRLWLTCVCVCVCWEFFLLYASSSSIVHPLSPCHVQVPVKG